MVGVKLRVGTLVGIDVKLLVGTLLAGVAVAGIDMQPVLAANSKIVIPTLKYEAFLFCFINIISSNQDKSRRSSRHWVGNHRQFRITYRQNYTFPNKT
jgi:hypothetical protein